MTRCLQITIVLLILLLTACTKHYDTAEFESTYEDACAALADNNIAFSQQLANQLRDMALGADSSSVSVAQYAQLSILYMKLSECASEEENIADATQLFRRAYRLSPDSLMAFYESMPLDDTRHFVLLRRLGSSIDNPIEIADTIEVMVNDSDAAIIDSPE